jgi:hypothetical protein
LEARMGGTRLVPVCC